ncbi:hypothetical protein SAMN05216319_2627 [Duganella sp. CF402]|nr:hypothetical protein EV582_0994 [Duganella sp. BK701]SEL75775.1 hypothetical protein SAMN05216319_2627 [Duganella sp. CF402]
MEYTTAMLILQGSEMPHQEDIKEDDGSPKFGRLLIVLIFAVLVCVGLTWVMATYFPNFPN